MEEIQGYVDHIVYSNPDNGYSVLVISTDKEDITCVGIFPSVSQGENLSLYGEYVEHPSYGRQLKVSKYNVIEPTTKKGIEKYLASGAIKGIGKATAKKIVSKFGDDTIRIMEEEPERLAEIKGISMSKAIDISNQIIEKKEVRDVMIYLEQYGIGSKLALRIYGEYGVRIYNILQENPYRLAEDINGVGFKTADEIAMKLNIAVDSDFRIRSAICYVLFQGTLNGHTYVYKEKLQSLVELLLSIEIKNIDIYLENLAFDKKIMIKEDAIYLMGFYQMESQSARMLLDLDGEYKVPKKQIENVISNIEKREAIKLDVRQKVAVEHAVSSGVCVLTGGPGTGKTTTIRTIIEYFESEGLDICLAAPTGRAAKRMSEATKRPAKTIHRMLEVKGVSSGDENASEEARFERNQMNPLDVDVIIVDEMSMVDISLFYNLLLAICPGTRLIMVGDTNQLPSVGAGNVLDDIISSELFLVVTLDKVFRQSVESDIVVNAHKINNGEYPVIDNKSEDFFLMKRYDADEIISTIIPLVQRKLPKYVEATSNDIQILAPSRKGLLGVNRLNEVLQANINPPSRQKVELKHNERILRVGDKVMQIKNNYQLEWKIIGKYGIAVENGTGVFNGDMGVVQEINTFAKLVTVLFDDNREVDYTYSQLDELEHAYAVTIHKSQGSEYPAVIIPLMQGPRPLMNRNLIYTAVTRAKSCVVIVGDENVFFEMIDNENVASRNSSLRERLVEFSEM